MVDTAENNAPNMEVKNEDNKEDMVKAELSSSNDDKGNVAKTELGQKIIKQIEYYFGDANLGRDKFLQEQIKLEDGWVTMETMLKFNRLKMLSQDPTFVSNAVRGSESGLMEVSEDGLKIRRSPARPLPTFSKELQEDLKKRSVYARGFPVDAKLDQVMEYFEKFGRVEHVQMRKDQKKLFKGSCFVTYMDKDGAKKFVETSDVKYSEEEMTRLFKEDYFKMKNEERKKKAEEAKAEKEQAEREKLREKVIPGAILVIDGVPEKSRRENIKSFFEKFGKVEWVDFEENGSKGRVRFSAAGEAKSALEKVQAENDGKVIWKEKEMQCSILDGDEELDHWVEIFKARAAKQVGGRRDNRNKGGRTNERGGKSRGSCKRKGGRDAGPQEKKVKKESDEGSNEENDDGDDGDE